jgi:hypothetical protein
MAQNPQDFNNLPGPINIQPPFGDPGSSTNPLVQGQDQPNVQRRPVMLDEIFDLLQKCWTKINLVSDAQTGLSNMTNRSFSMASKSLNEVNKRLEALQKSAPPTFWEKCWDGMARATHGTLFYLCNCAAFVKMYVPKMGWWSQAWVMPFWMVIVAVVFALLSYHLQRYTL